ncbi:hypothetical protein [Gordonia sp. NPDC003376]
MTIAVVAAVVGVLLVIPSLAFQAYLLWNKRTKAYFSKESVEIRRRHRNGGL